MNTRFTLVFLFASDRVLPHIWALVNLLCLSDA